MKIQLGKMPNNLDNKTIVNAYKKIFFSHEGRIVLDHMMTLSGLFEVNYEQKNTNRQSFYEGRRSLLLELIQIIEQDDKLVNYEGK